jgi:antitoxin (DNA-binding transcriptional repressor) of toxin-antitoxin stability system
MPASFLIDVRDLPDRFAEAMSQAAAGADVIVTQGSVPRARIVPIPEARPRKPGLHPGAMQMSEDFDAPLLRPRPPATGVPKVGRLKGLVVPDNFDEPL